MAKHKNFQAILANYIRAENSATGQDSNLTFLRARLYAINRLITRLESMTAVDAPHEQPGQDTVSTAEVIAAIEPLRPLWEQAGEGLHPSWYPVRDLYKRLVP